MIGSETLVLVGGEAPDAPVTWVRVGGSGAILAHGVVGVGASPPSAAPQRTVLVVPGADASVRRVELKAVSEAQARAALPHLFDGALATNGEGLHYAVGGLQDEEGLMLAAAIGSDRMAQWIKRCQAMGADPQRIFLDFTIWPVQRGELEIIQTPRLTIVAAGPVGGFSIEPSIAPQLFSRWLEQAPGQIGALNLLGGDAAEWRAKLGESAPPLRVRPPADPVLGLAVAAAAPPQYAPNLRQGAFATATSGRNSVHIWRFAAVLALLAVALQVGSMLLSGWRDHRAAHRVLARAEADFRTARPEVGRIVNLRTQVKALLNASKQAGSNPVLVVSESMVTALAAHPEVRLDELRHEPPGREVRIQLSSENAVALEAIADALRQAGLTVEGGEQRLLSDRYAAQYVVQAP